MALVVFPPLPEQSCVIDVVSVKSLIPVTHCDHRTWTMAMVQDLALVTTDTGTLTQAASWSPPELVLYLPLSQGQGTGRINSRRCSGDIAGDCNVIHSFREQTRLPKWPNYWPIVWNKSPQSQGWWQLGSSVMIRVSGSLDQFSVMQQQEVNIFCFSEATLI